MIHGVDLSLTGTWLATFNDDGSLSGLTTFRPKAKDGMARMDAIALAVVRLVEPTDLVVIEGLAFMSQTPSALERTGLWYLIRHWLWQEQIECVSLPPTSLKKFVTGKGNAEKQHMLLEVFKRWNISAADDNQADAYSLGRVGLCLRGVRDPETQAQREVLMKLGWKPSPAKVFEEIKARSQRPLFGGPAR